MDPLITTALVTIAIIATTFALVKAVRSRGLEHLRLEEIWMEFARSRGLAYQHPDPRLFTAPIARIGGAIGSVDVELETFSKGSGNNHSRHTRVAATAPSPFSLEGHVYMTMPFSGLGKLLGAQDVSTGDTAFDEQFTVKADNEVSARELLDDATRRAITDAGDFVTVHYLSGRVLVEWPTYEKDPTRLGAMLNLAVHIAERAPPGDPPRGDGETANAPPRRPSKRRRRD